MFSFTCIQVREPIRDNTRTFPVFICQGTGTRVCQNISVISSVVLNILKLFRWMCGGSWTSNIFLCFSSVKVTNSLWRQKIRDDWSFWLHRVLFIMLAYASSPPLSSRDLEIVPLHHDGGSSNLLNAHQGDEERGGFWRSSEWGNIGVSYIEVFYQVAWQQRPSVGHVKLCFVFHEV